MRFWFVHSGEVSLREQIVTQIMLGIASRELREGERLPSVRAMAQRYSIHANTVSAAYQELEVRGQVQSRRGSGVYVRGRSESRPAESLTPNVDVAMREFLRAMKAMGIEGEALRASFERQLDAMHKEASTLVEPDEALARIVLDELTNEGAVQVKWCRPENASHLKDEKVLVLPSKAERVRALLPHAEVTVLAINSVPQSLLAHGTIPADALIGIASHWQGFVQIAQTMLLARGVSADAVLVRNANDTGWQHGLETCAAVICDVVTARALPKRVRAIVFRLLAENTLTA